MVIDGRTAAYLLLAMAIDRKYYWST